MIENYDYYKGTYNIVTDELSVSSEFKLNSGDILTYFVDGNPDITEDVQFIGVDKNDVPLFLLLNNKHSVLVIEDTENLFPKR